MSLLLYTHAQYLTISAVGPKLKPYFVSTTCSSLDSIYQRGSCRIYWKKWTSPGPGRPNPDGELLFLPCLSVVPLLLARGCLLVVGTACCCHLSSVHLPTVWASWMSWAPHPFIFQGPVWVPSFLWSLCCLHPRSFLPPLTSPGMVWASFKTVVEMQSPRPYPSPPESAF